MKDAITTEGPELETLTRRLMECPPDFLLEPRIQERGVINVPAVVSDLFRDLGEVPLPPSEAELFQAVSEADRNRSQLILIVAWLLHDPWFRSRRDFSKGVYTVLAYGLSDLARLVAASKFVTEPDRREELVRYCLYALGLRPAGESDTQARDRLTTLSSVHREQVLRETRFVQERLKHIREELQRKAAEEAAAKVSRE